MNKYPRIGIHTDLGVFVRVSLDLLNAVARKSSALHNALKHICRDRFLHGTVIFLVKCAVKQLISFKL